MTRAARLVVVAVSVGLLAACGGSPDRGNDHPTAAADELAAQATGEPTPAASSPAADQPVAAAPVWVVGASPLPLRPDGFGEVLPTPEVLRDRRLPTTDLLPPPADGRFVATVQPVSDDVRVRMGESWSPACPVALADLRYLTVSFRGFDGAPHTGELVVAASVADDVVEVFRRLFADGFPIEEIRLPTTADLQAPPTGDGNNTAAYVCRAARGATRWSAHAYGTAVDINPFHNPLVRRDLVVPELASAYVDRSDVRPGMHVPGGPTVRAFSEAGWSWGGEWRNSKDYMHFSLDGS